ncbi:hypothetical protein E8E13_004909 [Curvularia kusanoi]|uniref:Uncharacterized protein n=1 Tax=Curvularia kusanoi TaxID=90978 RepID=A0A9P4TFF5_CURKU|nr:hypothetical protein E8E13_004909 [Curvularia kusanoi]
MLPPSKKQSLSPSATPAAFPTADSSTSSPERDQGNQNVSSPASSIRPRTSLLNSPFVPESNPTAIDTDSPTRSNVSRRRITTTDLDTISKYQNHLKNILNKVRGSSRTKPKGPAVGAPLMDSDEGRRKIMEGWKGQALDGVSGKSAGSQSAFEPQEMVQEKEAGCDRELWEELLKSVR